MLFTDFSKLLYKLAGTERSAYLFVEVITRLEAVSVSFLEEAHNNHGTPNNFKISSFVQNAVRGISNEVDLWEFYESARSYLQGLNSSVEQTVESDRLVKELTSKTEAFLEHYKRYMISRDFLTAFDLMLLAHKIYPMFSGLAAASKVAAENLASFQTLDDSELEIYSRSGVDDVSDYIKILRSFEEIYSAAARLLDVSLDDEPLQIARIESGSLLIKLKGAAKVLRVVRDIVMRVAQFTAMNYSVTGRIDQLPKSAEAVSSVLRLRESLANNGIDVSSMDAEIESAALKIAKQANVLMDRLDDIRIDGELLNLKRQLLIELQEEEAPQRLLGHDDADENAK